MRGRPKSPLRLVCPGGPCTPRRDCHRFRTDSRGIRLALGALAQSAASPSLPLPDLLPDTSGRMASSSQSWPLQTHHKDTLSRLGLLDAGNSRRERILPRHARSLELLNDAAATFESGLEEEATVGCHGRGIPFQDSHCLVVKPCRIEGRIPCCGGSTTYGGLTHGRNVPVGDPPSSATPQQVLRCGCQCRQLGSDR